MLKFCSKVAVMMALTGGAAHAQQLPPGPNSIQPSEIRVLAEYAGTMPFTVGPGLLGGTFGANLQSPVPVGKSLYFVDHIDGIYYEERRGDGVKKVFSLADGDAPEGLLFRIPDLSDGTGGTREYQQRQAVFNLSEGSAKDKVYVTLVAVVGSTLPDVPRYTLPDPVGGPCCAAFSPPFGFIDNYYDIKPEEVAPILQGFGLDFPYPGIEHQIIYEFTLKNQKLVDPRPIVIFDSQGGPLHHGSAMLTLKDGRILYVTGDAVAFGLSGLSAPQDPNSHLSKLLIVNPEDGAVELAATGLRNVQYMQIVEGKGINEQYLAFADIGGWTAEEVNVVSLDDILDTSVVENFGWGVNADGFAREGTFYVAATPSEGVSGLGAVAFSFGTPDVVGQAPVPEPGFIQPYAQYRRPANGDPLGGVASSGPATSRQFTDLTMVFSDLSSGILYGTTSELDAVDSTVFALKIVGEDGTEYDTFQQLLNPDNPPFRSDPRFFRFPDGSAGVLLEATGDYFRLSEM